MNNASRVMSYLAGFWILYLAACLPTDRYVDGIDCAKAFDKYYERNPSTYRTFRFESFSRDEQYQVYICGNQYIHPPILALAETYARQGEDAVAFLKGKLTTASSDYTIINIVRVFSEMDRLETYKVGGDEELLASVRSAIGRIRDSEWRRLAEQDLAAIEKSKP